MACLSVAPGVRAQTPAAALSAPAPDSVQLFLTKLEQLVRDGDSVGYLDLVSGTANRARAAEFARTEIQAGATRAVVKERERLPFGGTGQPAGYRIIVDVFSEFGDLGRVATWQLDVQRRGDEPLQIFDEVRLTTVERLFRLSLNEEQQFSAQALSIHAEDFDLDFESGNVFVSSIDPGITAVVLVGRGDMHFHPKPDTEKTQVRIFCGRQTLDTAFTTAFLRMDPSDFQQFIDIGKLKSVPVDPRELKRADDVFKQDYRKSYHLNLGDLSTDPWSLLPGSDNFVAEVHTRRYGILTYARSKTEFEDISLFDRLRHRNIAVYSSEETLARRGRFYNEDDLREYDVLDYNVDVALSPGRQWIDGVTTLTLQVKAPQITSVMLRLADPLTVRSITSDKFGRLFGFRVNNQNLVVINLPAPVAQDEKLRFTFVYAGRLEPQMLEGNETIAVAQEGLSDIPEFQAEPSYLYSNRSAWYPQATTSDYATATLKISIPSSLDCVASGVLDEGWPKILGSKEEQSERKVYSFTAAEPLRYLAFIVSKLQNVGTRTLEFPEFGKSLRLSVEVNPRQVKRGRELLQSAADIATFYATLTGDIPYPTFTIAAIENDLPGGHSPAYFAELFTPLPMSVLSWRNDPAAFDRFPEFFLAHELAHQWFGHGVGWGNYHEQWLSEAFAQYFAALYAQHQRGDNVFAGVLRQMRRWAINESDQGPVYLGYRLGHIKNDGRIFRALVYNKGAAVLHMLRRLIGDEAFFRGVRRFYASAKFRKAGTDELREAFEKEAGRPLDRFFEQWIYGSSLPKLKAAYKVEGNDLVVHIEQLGEPFELPVTFAVEFDDRKKSNVVIAVSERVTDRRVSLPAPPRGVSINKDDGVLAEITQ